MLLSLPMKISIIIPVKPGGAVAAIEGLRNLDPDSPDHEVIVAEGKKPSRQRNMAAGEATGDILYFLDDDALVVPDALKRLAACFADQNVAAVGGPSLTPLSDSVFQRSIGWALASAFGGGAVRNRYRSVGLLRDSDDRELILCNLAFRREVYLSFRGLDERLYPNEENELIDRLLQSGVRLLHDPGMFVRRSQRPTLAAFIRQMKTYGKGRAEQTLISRTVSFKALIPALFALYALTLPFVRVWWYFIPALIYCLGVLTNMLLAVNREGLPLALRLPMVYTLLHFCYGAGFIAGLLSPRYSKAAESSVAVTMKRLKNFGSSW
jgi:cellulose synthase/poly-beta-1,6-N-acetylglucosamine synthase-like glycosyltransferase